MPPDHTDYLHAAILLAERAAAGEDVSAAVDALAEMAGEGQPADEGDEE